MADLLQGLQAVMDTWGLCSICDGEHAWANVKCDLLDTACHCAELDDDLIEDGNTCYNCYQYRKDNNAN